MQYFVCSVVLKEIVIACVILVQILNHLLVMEMEWKQR